MEDYRHKLDGVMRRLLEMDDAAIRKHVREDDRRLQRLGKEVALEVDRALPAEIDRLVQAKLLPKKPAAREVKAVRSQLLRQRARKLQPDWMAALVVRERLPRVMAHAIVTFTGNRADLEALGLEVRTQAQDVFTVVGTASQLKALAAQAACQRLRSPRIFYPVVENASAQAEIADVHQPRPANPNGYEGNGVLLGVIDSCLDITHHTFRDPASPHGTRVEYYWVQSPYTVDATGNPVYANLTTLPGQDPAAWSAAGAVGTRPSFNNLNYGRLYTRAFLDTALGLATAYGTNANQVCCEPWYDATNPAHIESEHGTHCAGIAAGNGREANWSAGTHVGAAPQATLIFVGLGQLEWGTSLDGTFEDYVLDGIRFCLEVGRFLGMPVVISISQATNFGAHNGAADFDHAVDNLLNSFFDRSVVIAAGNDNNDFGYASGSVAANNGTANFTLTDNANAPFYLDLWYSGPELDYQITHAGVNSGWKTAGQEGWYTVGGHGINVDRDAEPGGMRNIRMYFRDARIGNTYTIDLRNPSSSQAADYHAYIGIQAQAANISGAAQNTHTLGDSACGRSVLTVGACLKLATANPAAGEAITSYSGAGPTLDGRVKPEIVAVGDHVVSAASDQASGWVSMSGTSMSTPLTAGAVALLMDAYGRTPLNLPLNQDTIKALFVQHSNTLNLNLDPAQAGYQAEQRNRYGNGRLRMIDAIDLSQQPPPNVDVWVRTANDDYGEEPYRGDCFCGSPDIRVFQAGTNTEITALTWGATYDVRVTVRNLGISNAVGTTVQLKYALPHAAAAEWFEAEDASNTKLTQTVTVNAMNQSELLFHWRPEQGEIINAPATQTHFCLLALLDHALDPLPSAAAGSGASAWSTYIKGTNNIALRNLFIQ
jgi:subtilisin family serine protease